MTSKDKASYESSPPWTDLSLSRSLYRPSSFEHALSLSHVYRAPSPHPAFDFVGLFCDCTPHLIVFLIPHVSFCTLATDCPQTRALSLARVQMREVHNVLGA